MSSNTIQTISMPKQNKTLGFFLECLAKVIISDIYKSWLEITFLCILWQPWVKGCQRCQISTLSG